MVTVILLFVLILLVAIFSVQNAIPVFITFFLWKFEASLAIIVFLSAICGMIAGLIIAMLIRMKSEGKKEKKSQPRSPTNL
jgi:uncharacterized integral membrane protein